MRKSYRDYLLNSHYISQPNSSDSYYLLYFDVIILKSRYYFSHFTDIKIQQQVDEVTCSGQISKGQKQNSDSGLQTYAFKHYIAECFSSVKIPYRAFS